MDLQHSLASGAAIVLVDDLASGKSFKMDKGALYSGATQAVSTALSPYVSDQLSRMNVNLPLSPLVNDALITAGLYNGIGALVFGGKPTVKSVLVSAFAAAGSKVALESLYPNGMMAQSVPVRNPSRIIG